MRPDQPVPILKKEVIDLVQSTKQLINSISEDDASKIMSAEKLAQDLQNRAASKKLARVDITYIKDEEVIQNHLYDYKIDFAEFVTNMSEALKGVKRPENSG